MTVKTRKIQLTILGVCALLIASVATVFASPLQVASDLSFLYRIEERQDGTLKVSVAALPDDQGTMARYRQANTRRAQTLLRQAETLTGMKQIFVQVTFVGPLPWAEAKDLADSAGLQVESVLLVGRGNQNEKATILLNQSMDAPLPTELRQGPRGQSTTIQGVMVLQGYVRTTAKSLGRLHSDARIELVDTTASQVKNALDRNPLWRGKPIAGIALPSPYWELAW